MLILFCFLLFILFWLSNRRSIAICFLMTYLMDGYGLSFMGTPVINSYNVNFVLTNIFLVYDIYKNKKKTDKITKFMLWFYGFFIASFVITFIGGIDTLKYASSVLRQTTSAFLLYFVIKQLKEKDVEKSIHYLFCIYSVLLILYAINLLGIPLYRNQQAYEGASEGDVAYARNFGILQNCVFFFFYAIINLKLKHKWIAFLFILPTLMGGGRGSLLSIIGAFLITFFSSIKKFLKPRVIMGLLVILIPATWLFNKYFKDSFDRNDESVAQQIKNNFDFSILTDYNSFVNSRQINGNLWNMDNGTLAFRTAMSFERLQYLLENPKYFLFGVGMIDEQSPNNRFHFILGTSNDYYKYGYTQISTVDTIWPPIILRFGLIGIMLLCSFFWIFYRKFKMSKNTIGDIGELYVIYLFLASFGQVAPISNGSLMFLFMWYRLYSVKLLERK